MSVSTNLDVAVDGTQAMTLLLDGIESLLPSEDPIAAVVRNQLGYDMQVIAQVTDHGEVEVEPGGGVSGTIPNGSDLIFGMKSIGNGTKGIVLLASTCTHTVQNVEGFVVASFFYQHTYWGTKGVNGGILIVPAPVYPAIERDPAQYAKNLMDTFAKATQSNVFQSSSTSGFVFDGEMIKIKSPPPQNEDELRATFNMGTT